MEDPEREPRSSLIRGVSRDRLAVGVGREDLGRGEEAGRERRLAGAGRANKDNQRRVRDTERSRLVDARQPSPEPARRRSRPRTLRRRVCPARLA
jgi:hypothetical protein